MATKAERFKAQQAMDANPPKAKEPKRPPRNRPVDTAKPGVSATNRKAGAGHSGMRNLSKRVAKAGGAALEDSETGVPSRKSTRRSSGRIKRTSNLQRKAVRETASGKARATRSRARKSKSSTSR
jgi:hypothetical protein